MNILLPMLASLILVTAQATWKKAFSTTSITFSQNFLLSKDFLKLFLSSYFILGVCLYLVATFFYIYLFNKYSFYSVQSIMLVTSITLAFLIASFIFKESVTVYKIAGLTLLIFGIVLIYKK